MEKLSQQEEALLNIDFGPELEKMAADRAAAITDAYDYGFEKHAAAVAAEFDKLAEEEEDEDEDEDEDEEMDEESEKAAAELGAFIERGFFDGLRKLGAERHNDELHYIMPYVMQKVAAGKAQGAMASMKKLWSQAKDVGAKGVEKAKGYAQEVSPSAIQQEAKGTYEQARRALTGKGPGGGNLGKNKRMEAGKKALIGAGKTVGRASPYAAGAGAVGYGGYKALGGGKED